MATPGTVVAPYFPYTLKLANQNLDALLPAGGRTTPDIPTYLADNAVLNVKDFGALGNGSTDDTSAFQAAITAATANGGVIFMPVGTYVISSQLILTGGITLKGSGSGSGSGNTSRILWTGTGFCIKVGNTASSLTYGCNLSDFSIGLLTTNSGIWTYGASKCSYRNIDIEGAVSSTASIGVQIDGANISSFFNVFDNVNCNHVFKGFVHMSSGTSYPTSQTMIGCTAFCDNTVGSMGVEIQVAPSGNSCGTGVMYVNGYMESCATGVQLTAGGCTITGMHFENTQGVASDITFGTLCRNASVIGCHEVYTITNIAGSRSNQVIGTSQNESGVVSQQNTIDQLTIGGDIPLTFVPDGATPINVLITSAGSSYTGSLFLQPGGRSAAFGGSVTLYGHANATHPGDVTVGISSGSGGAFRVNSTALDGGTDWLKVLGAMATFTGSLTIGPASSRIIPGATSLALRNSANNADNLILTDAGAATVRNGLTVTTGGATVSAGGAAITGNSTVTGTLAVTAGFGANGATPQTAFASGGAAPAGGTGATAGAYDTAAHRDALITLVNNMRTALVNMGIMS